MKNKLIYIMVVSIGLMGCDQAKILVAKANRGDQKQEQAKAPAVQFVESPELAKIILKPQQKAIAIKRDPFRPIVSKDSGFDPLNPGGQASDLGDIVVIGVVKMGDSFAACLRVNKKVGIYHVNDKIGKYTVLEISSDQVVFKSSNNKVVKKRGKK